MEWYEFKPSKASSEPQPASFMASDQEAMEATTFDFLQLASSSSSSSSSNNDTKQALEHESTSVEDTSSRDVHIEDWEARIQDAYERGRDEAQQELDAMLEEHVEHELQAQRNRWLAALEHIMRWKHEHATLMAHAVAELGRVMAERIIEQELTIHPESYLPMIQGALERSFEFDEIKLHVPPQAAKMLKTHTQKLLHEHPELDALDIIVDEEMKPGDCALTSSGVCVDGDLEPRLEQLVAVARSALGSSGALEPEPDDPQALMDSIQDHAQDLCEHTEVE